ncbi:MAG: PEGA domain-containing protein [Candidatus Acidiferrales bacterium]|jgi:PEGA domain-containing protein
MSLLRDWTFRGLSRGVAFVLLAMALMLVAALVASAQNEPVNPTTSHITGEVELKPVTKPDRAAGVWVDGQYVGFVKELHGEKKILLLPGEHEVSIRQAAYKNQDQKIVVEPGHVTTITVRLERDPNVEMPSTTSEIKLDVTPDRAAVFLDGAYAGSVGDFKGLGHGMLVEPGKHTIKIDLAGYRPFETEVTLLPKQKFTVKTNLEEGSILQADPAIKSPTN